MARFAKQNLGWFLSGLFIALIVSFCLIHIFSVRAQEQINIFTTFYSGDWQNPEAVFCQDLGEYATLEEFNAGNSSYPLFVSPAEETATTQPALPPVIEATTTQATTTQEMPTSTEEAEVPPEEIPEEETEETETEETAPPVEEAPAQEEEIEVPSETITTTTEGTVPAETVKPSFLARLWQKLEDLFADEAQAEESLEATTTETVDEEATTTESIVPEETLRRSVLALSDFAVPQEFKENIIRNVQLRMSLAGRGEIGDGLTIDYLYQDSWRSLAEFSLEEEFSNALNGGYFLYALPIFQSWDDLANLEVRLTFQTKQDNSLSEVYLDAAWMEIEYGTGEPEPLPEEPITEEEAIEEEELPIEEPVEEPTAKKLPKIKIRDSSLIIVDLEKEDFRSDEEPLFVIGEPNITPQELISEGKGELIEGEIIQIDIPTATTSSGISTTATTSVPSETSTIPVASTTSATTTATSTIPTTSDVSSTSSEQGEVPEEEPENEVIGLLEKAGEFLKKGIKNLASFIIPTAKAQTNNIRIKIFDPEGRESSIVPQITSYLVDGKERFKVKLAKPERGFKPGAWRMEIEFETDQAIFITEQDFTWGVLAINTSKSIYLPSERAYLQMAALNNEGHTICDANLKLEIIPPSGGRTSANVERSGECGPDNITNVPDYFVYYQTGGAGTYQMKLANLDNGYEITDSFEVRESVPFDIERIGPTRIYPPAEYQITLRIKTNQDFSGEVKEYVPSSFVIDDQFPISNFQTISNDQNSKQLIWQVGWKAGETHELRYQFDAPDISPYLYLLGPLEFYD